MPQEKTYSQMREEFSKTFYKSIAPRIQQYEYERISILVTTLFICLILVLIASWIVYHGFTTNGGCSRSEAKIVISLLFLAFGIYWLRKKCFEEYIKGIIMPKICKCYGNLTRSCNSYKLSTIFSTTKIIDYYDNVEFDDIFVGQFKNVNYEIIESKFTKGSDRNETIVFDGVIIKLDMNKPFLGRTVIRPNSLLHSSPHPILKHTELEDIQFEKKFDVFTDDEVEARYLITPSFMERLNEMQVAFTADKVSCAFYKKYLFIALHTSKDLFSICSLFKKIDDPKQFFTMFEEILSIIKLIDHFKLNQKIGL